MGEAVRRHWKAAAAIVVATLVVACGVLAYTNAIRSTFYRECSDNLHDVLEQSGKTFDLFAQRNWNYLADADVYFSEMSGRTDVEERFSAYASRRNSWNYDEVYLFNEGNDYLTASSRTGNADSIDGVYSGLYERGDPLLTSYVSSAGVRKVAFARRLSSPFTIGGVTYTGLAVTYTNDVLQSLVSSDVYGDDADSYLLRADGDVVFSLTEKSVFEPFILNMAEFLGEQGLAEGTELAGFSSALADSEAGTLVCRYGGVTCYLVWQPVGIGDLSIFSVVRAGAVDEGLRQVRDLTVGLIALVVSAGAGLLVWGVVTAQRSRLRTERAEREAVEGQKELYETLSGGLSRIVDRFALCDLESGRYVYREHQLGRELYPCEGDYEDLVAAVDERYVALSNDDEVKMGVLLRPERIRGLLRRKDDMLKIEYCERNRDVYRLMSVVPVERGREGLVSKVMLIAEDIGQRVELQNMANTDGLTGLLNERCFSSVLRAKEKDGEPFTLFYLDLDRFKPVNDTYGHDMGDKLLKMVAARLKGSLRPRDYVFRIGGDEFAAVVAGELGDEDALVIERRLATSLGAPYDIDGVAIEVGASIGRAAFPADSESAEALRILADHRMYEQKKTHHGRR